MQSSDVDPNSASHRRPRKPPWCDEYFYVHDSNKSFLTMFIRSCDSQPAPKGSGMGVMIKHATPSDFGESREHPVRSLLLLRAWAWWRANLGDWAKHRKCMRNYFAEHPAFLERDVTALGAPCRLLGNKTANAIFTELVPDLVARLRSS